MTTDIAVPINTHTVAGTGPYAVSWPYDEAELLVWAELDGEIAPLSNPAQWTASPTSTLTGGEITLAGAVATAFAGARLVIERATVQEQGWQGAQGREIGLTAALDRTMRAVQDLKAQAGGTLRILGMTGLAPIAEPVEGSAILWDGSKFAPGPTADDIALAQGNADLAEAWAQSPTAPDPEDPTSKSAKTWAGEAEAARDEAVALAEGLRLENRAAALAWQAANPTPPVGTVLNWGGIGVRFVGSGTAIADMPGWVPNGGIYPEQFAENATPGTTDMSAAANAAVAYLLTIGGGTLVFDGDYAVSDSINLANGIVYQGGGWESTEIRATGNFPVFNYSGNISSQLARAVIRDMKIRGGGKDNLNAHGVALSWTNKPKIENVQFRSCRWCVTAEYTIDLSMDYVFCEGQGADQNYGGLFLGQIDVPTHGTRDNTQILSNISFRHVEFCGIRGEGCTGMKATNIACLNGVHGWYFGDAPLGADARLIRFLHLSGCYADTQTTTGFLFSRGSMAKFRDVKMINCWAGSTNGDTGKSVSIDGMEYSVISGGVLTLARANLIHIQNSNDMTIDAVECYDHDWGETGDDSILLQACSRMKVANLSGKPHTLAGTAALRMEGCDSCSVMGGAVINAVGVELHNTTKTTVHGVAVEGSYAPVIESGTSNFNSVIGTVSTVVSTLIGASSFVFGEAGTTNPRMRMVGGSAAAPAIYMGGATNSGLYRSGTHGLAYSGDGVRRWEVSETRFLMDPSLLPEYADDAAAAAGGIPVSVLYRTGSIIKVRIS